jgi:hypothetical protein
MKLSGILSLAVFVCASSTPTIDVPTEGVYTVSEPEQTAQGDIKYSPGNVMANGVNVYCIYYGDHSQDTKDIIERFVKGLSGSEWWGVVETYYGKNGHIKPTVTYKGSYQDNFSKGKSLSSNFFNNAINDIVDHAITAAKWPRDDDGIYVVFTSKDVSERTMFGGFCSDYCGYHGMNGNLKVSMVGDSTRCPGTLPPPGQAKGTAGCMQRYYRNQTDAKYSINRNQNADSMIDVLAHELAEAASDYENTWRDEQGLENGDKVSSSLIQCAAYMLDIKGIGEHSPYNDAYNVDFGVYGKYLLQSMWSASKQACVLSEKQSPSVFATRMRHVVEELPYLGNLNIRPMVY